MGSALRASPAGGAAAALAGAARSRVSCTSEGTMRMRLAESAHRRERRLGGTFLSVAAHTAAILLAIYATAQGDPAPPTPEAAPIRVVFRAPPPASPVAPGGPTTRARGGPLATPATPTLPVVPNMPITVPLATTTGLPPIDPLAGHGAVGDAEFARRTPPLGDGGGGAALPGPGGYFDAATVERPAELRDALRPRYPDALRERGTSGVVVARYVVDSSGHLEAGSVSIVEATDPRFADAVREALARARFRPAEGGGRRVAQLVEQRFEFRMDGREGGRSQVPGSTSQVTARR